MGYLIVFQIGILYISYLQSSETFWQAAFLCVMFWCGYLWKSVYGITPEEARAALGEENNDSGNV